MISSSSTIIFFPGAGGEVPNLIGFEGGENRRFEAVHYPEWRHFGVVEFTVETFMENLETQIETKAPIGSIQIVGYSIGAHLGYLTALRLRAKGRQITGFCVLDSFMIESVSPSPGWQRRALGQATAIIRTGRVGDFGPFVRSKLYRALLRLSPRRLPNLLCRIDPVGLLGRVVISDQVLCKELRIHFLVRKVVLWFREIDSCVTGLYVPTIVLRTKENFKYDQAWRRRCPNLQIIEIPGQHQNLFNSENIGNLRSTFAEAMLRLG
jgi:thioesterase domain-containing protein